MNNQRNAAVEHIFRLAKDFCFMLHFSIPLYLTGTRKSLHKQFSWNRFFQLVTFFFHWNLTTSCTDKADGKLRKWYWWATQSGSLKEEKWEQVVHPQYHFIWLQQCRNRGYRQHLVRRSCGLRNIDSMLNMIYLTCSFRTGLRRISQYD